MPHEMIIFFKIMFTCMWVIPGLFIFFACCMSFDEPSWMRNWKSEVMSYGPPVVWIIILLLVLVL